MRPSFSLLQVYSESKRELRYPEDIKKVKEKRRGKALLYLAVYLLCMSAASCVSVWVLRVPGAHGGGKRGQEPWQQSCRWS